MDQAERQRERERWIERERGRWDLRWSSLNNWVSQLSPQPLPRCVALIKIPVIFVQMEIKININMGQADNVDDISLHILYVPQLHGTTPPAAPQKRFHFRCKQIFPWPQAECCRMLICSCQRVACCPGLGSRDTGWMDVHACMYVGRQIGR